MSQIEQLLKYQEKDSELLKIEQEIASSDERKKYVQTQSFLKKASDKLDKLEAQSQSVIVRLETLTKRYDEANETLKDFDNLDGIDDGSQLSFYQRSLSSVVEEIKNLKGEIAKLAQLAKELTDEFQAMKKKVIAAQNQYPELKAAYQKFKQSKQDETDRINAELEKLAKGVDEEVMRKYQSKRPERIFPIICQVRADRCPKCGIELSIADKEVVGAGKVVECEHCRRLLYKA